MKLCEHELELTMQHLFDFGRNKIFYYKCKNCGKETSRFLDSKKELPKKGLCFNK